MTNNLKVTDFELDELKESVNIGASHASDALSKLISKKVLLSVPEVNIDNFINSIRYVGGGVGEMTSIKVRVQSPKNGVMFYLFPNETDVKLLKIINPSRPDSRQLSDDDLAILSEIGNILSGNFLSAIAKFLGMNLIHSVSEITSGEIAQIANSAISEIIHENDEILILKISLDIREEDIKTSLFFLMDPSFTDNILNSSQKIIN